MKIIFTVIFVILTIPTFAQNANSSYTDDPLEESTLTDPNYDWSWKAIPTAPPPPPVPVPIDGGISLLLLAGIGYGIRRLK